jgi:hypothetical protein
MKNFDPFHSESDSSPPDDIWKPLTPEEADQEFDAAPDESFTPDEIEALVNFIMVNRTQAVPSDSKGQCQPDRHAADVEKPKPVQLDLFGDPVQRIPTVEDLVVKAFVEIRNGWSSEYVVCHPEVNRRFLNRVHELAPSLTDADANRILWNARRAGKLAHLPRSRRCSPDKHLVHFEFACEWAYRHLINDLVGEGHRRKNTTLDRIFCIPEWRGRFDTLVTKIKPGFSLLDYRLVSMTVRKRSRKRHRVEASLFNEYLPVQEALKNLPDLPGVYLIRSKTDKDLYTGWTENLREQADRHFEAGQGSMIPDWILPNESPAASIAFHCFEKEIKNSELHETWRANLVRRNPPLNLFEGLAI